MKGGIGANDSGCCADRRPSWSLPVIGEGFCPGLSLGGTRGWGMSCGGSCWIRGVQGLCKVCSLHGVVSDVVLWAGVEPSAVSVGLAVGG